MDTNIKLTQLIVEDVIRLRINKAKFYDFVSKTDKDHKYPKSATRLSLAYDFFENYPDAEKTFSEFAIKTIMYGKSRIITESNIAKSPAPLKSKDKLKKQLNLSEDDLNFNAIMLYQPGAKFKEIYRNIVVDKKDKDIIKHIDLVYCRKYIDLQPKSEPKLKGEYVWIEINYDKYKVRMHFSSDRSNRINPNLPSKTMVLFEHFRSILQNDFGIRIEERNEEELIFKLYSYLTKKDEAKYLQKVSARNTEIKNFCDETLKKLKVEESDEVFDRIKGVMLRAIIQSDFDNFKHNPNVEGRVKGFSFSDREGTRLQASKGPGRSLIGDEINIEDSTAYFDNKETINKAGKLSSVKIVWNPGYDGITDRVQVRYTAYPSFLEMHFLYREVTEDEYENVLRKTEKIRNN